MAIALMVDFAIDKFFDSSIHLVKYTLTNLCHILCFSECLTDMAGLSSYPSLPTLPVPLPDSVVLELKLRVWSPGT